MKKIMIGAAVAAMSVCAFGATLNYVDCLTSDPTDTCETLVFKLTASGKTVQDVNEGAYKAVKALKISKGAMAFNYDEDCADAGACCYTTADLFAQVKVGSKTTKLAIADIEIGKWSIFGKTFESKVRDYLHTMKKGSSATVESDLFLSGDGLTATFEDETEVEVSLWASAFGQMTASLSKGKTGSDKYCDPQDEQECVLSFLPKSYNGWFVGQRELISDGWCFNCACGEYDVFGGTFKLCFQKKYTTAEGAQKLAFGKVIFGADDDDE